MKEISVRTVVIGSGCAGLNAADWLWELGERDVLLLTENMNSGTSRNTGSDKQTYYKLSLSGDEGDSVGALAAMLLGSRGDVNGDTALCEAAASAKSFFKLAGLGVPFPCNEYGEYVGYQTDHDHYRRATSAGPLTSRFMTEALEKSVRSRGVPIRDQALACRILTDEAGVAGVLCLDKENRDWLLIRCAHAVLCTGGPAQIYRDSVFPLSQCGMSGMAFEAGAEGANLHCWQYGLASIRFRWNVSGSYQQALPRYISVDEAGAEREFLADALGEEQAMALAFLKGYQWPFDEEKAPGSSQVDLLVKAETDRGRRVYMDFRRSPRGFATERLSAEARDYLQNCGALQETPLARLAAMNAPAIALYRDHGIDLAREPLEVRVCAQHHNGGVAVDEHWQTRVPGLYACGEAAGTFGRYRPGGTALNSTQAGSLRAAEHIARQSRRQCASGPLDARPPLLPAGDAKAITAALQSAMSRCAAFQRSADEMAALEGQIAAYMENAVPAALDDPQLITRLRLRDLMLTQREVLSAMICGETAPGPGVLYTRSGRSAYRPARPIPQRDLWFERVWKQYREREANK